MDNWNWVDHAAGLSKIREILRRIYTSQVSGTEFL